MVTGGLVQPPEIGKGPCASSRTKLVAQSGQDNDKVCPERLMVREGGG
jgi:hypothetical protein